MKVPFVTGKEVVYTMGRLRRNPNLMLSKARFPLFPSFFSFFQGFYVRFLGQVTQMAKYLTSVYVSGWQCSSTASTSNEPGPDVADYPYDTVPNKACFFFQDFLEENDGKMASMARMARMAIEKSGGFAIQVDLERFLIWNLEVSEKPSRNPVQKSQVWSTSWHFVSHQKPTRQQRKGTHGRLWSCYTLQETNKSPWTIFLIIAGIDSIKNYIGGAFLCKLRLVDTQSTSTWRIIPLSKWWITMVCKSPRVVGLLPNGRTSWLKNMGAILTQLPTIAGMILQAVHWGVFDPCRWISSSAHSSSMIASSTRSAVVCLQRTVPRHQSWTTWCLGYNNRGEGCKLKGVCVCVFFLRGIYVYIHIYIYMYIYTIWIFMDIYGVCGLSPPLRAEEPHHCRCWHWPWWHHRNHEVPRR